MSEKDKGTPLPKKSKEEVRLDQFLKDNGITREDLERYEIALEYAKSFMSDENVNEVKEKAHKGMKRSGSVALPSALIGGLGSAVMAAVLGGMTSSKDKGTYDIAKKLQWAPAITAISGMTPAIIAGVKGLKDEEIYNNPTKEAGKPIKKELESRKKKEVEMRKKLKEAFLPKVSNGIKMNNNTYVYSEKDLDDYINGLSYSELVGEASEL